MQIEFSICIFFAQFFGVIILPAAFFNSSKNSILINRQIKTFKDSELL